jgi:hypothetical protein
MEAMTENKEFIYQSILSQLRMGFLSIEEIKENIIEEVEDNDFEGKISKEWISESIDMAWQSLLLESKQWKRPTDTERLVKVFDELCKSNIIALHKAGYTNSDCESEVVEVELVLRKKKIRSDGYCFYHEQDLLEAIKNEKPYLHIAFQKVDNTNTIVAIEVGKKVVEKLKKYGFRVDWSETPTTKILIPNFKWQLIYDDNNRNLLDYNEVVKLMTE